MTLKRGNTEAGLALFGPALDDLRGVRFAVYHTSFRAEFAEGLGRAGRVPEGIVAITEALARSEQTGERWCLPELLRIRGELALLEATSRSSEDAEAYFVRALASARQQQVLSWELRAATSLARLWRGQQRVTQARKLLGPVYRRFTEGFETADLIAAKALLDSVR